MSDEPDLDPITRWVLVSRNLFAAYGIFRSEQACWDFCSARQMSPTLFITIPLLPPNSPTLDIEKCKRQLEEGQPGRARKAKPDQSVTCDWKRPISWRRTDM